MIILILVDELEPGTNTTVKWYGKGGTALQLLTGTPVLFSGYLISWRFYHVSGGSTCDSYAAVWREERDSDNFTSYRLVDRSETLLTSDSQSGVYNTAIEDRIVRVNQGDVISIHVNENSSCSFGGVSFRTNNTGDPPAEVYPSYGYPVLETLQMNGSMDDNVTTSAAAIQAYVEGRRGVLLTVVILRLECCTSCNVCRISQNTISSHSITRLRI